MRLPANAPTCSGQLFLYIKIKIIAKDRDAFLLFNTNLFSQALHGDGVIWPTHIIERPESGFKQRLMHVLGKPFGEGEYEKLYGMATIRKMALKERRTRSGVKYYDSIHEKSKSYYDRYPGMLAFVSCSYFFLFFTSSVMKYFTCYFFQKYLLDNYCNHLTKVNPLYNVYCAVSDSFFPCA